MKKTITLLLCSLLTLGAMAKGSSHSGGGKSGGAKSSGKSSSSGKSHAIKGHVTKKGTYVAPTRATNPNKTKKDNYSQKGNVNPATGKEGTKN